MAKLVETHKLYHHRFGEHQVELEKFVVFVPYYISIYNIPYYKKYYAKMSLVFQKKTGKLSKTRCFGVAVLEWSNWIENFGDRKWALDLKCVIRNKFCLSFICSLQLRNVRERPKPNPRANILYSLPRNLYHVKRPQLSITKALYP